MFKCKHPGCERTDKGSRGWCVLHYHRHYNKRPMSAKPILRGAEPVTRFMSHVKKNKNGCWTWTAHRIRSGYGMFKFDGKSRLAHKWYYERIHGKVKKPLQLDHICMVKNCVNPEHLEVVLPKENVRRAHIARLTFKLPPEKKPKKTHCPYGHPYSGNNLRMIGPNHRQCITCHRKATREYYWRRKNVGTKAHK